MNFREALKIVRPHTALDEARLRNLNFLAQETAEVPGDAVECGAGGSSALLAWAMAPSKNLWVYDTFRGLPAPGAKDGPAAVPYAGASEFSTLTLRTLLDQVGVPRGCVRLMVGDYAETFASPGPSAISLLHVDCDWYDSVYAALRRWEPLVPAGGVVVLDDFGHWPGARKALQAYLHVAEIPLPNIERVGEAAWWLKE